jgi:hypothetical protein
MDGQKTPSWRDVYKPHRAAELFPILPKDERRKLGEDIAKNGLKERVILYTADHSDNYVVLDGRNRLDAMESVGIPTLENRDSKWRIKSEIASYCTAASPDWTTYISIDRAEIPDPYAYVISKNIHRRHLTKKQQAEIIARAMMAAENDFAKSARSFNPESGKCGGSTKDPIKEKIVNKAKEYDIGKRTAENGYANVKGPTQKPRKTSKRTAQSSATAGDRTGSKSLEEQLRESEQARRQVEAHAQKEIGRVEGELRDAQKRNAALRDNIEKFSEYRRASGNPKRIEREDSPSQK